MLQLPRSSLSIIQTAKNGVKTALLKAPNGISAIGAIFTCGAEDSPKSGETFLTLQAKLLDSIQTPENMFKYAITPDLKVYRDHSTILLTYLPESSKIANTVLDQMFSSKPPSTKSVEQAKTILGMQELVGNITPEQFFESTACSASYNHPKHKIEIYTNNVSGLTINHDLLSNLKESAILFGSHDESSNLKSLALSLNRYKPKEFQQSIFTPGFCTKELNSTEFQGVVLQKNLGMQYGILSFPSVSRDSKDFLVYKVIQKIFGDVYEFSSEGIGVGLNSLLYKHGIAYGCEYLRCFFFPYAKNGLFSFAFKAESESMPLVTKKIARCVSKAIHIDDDHFNSAKEQSIVDFLKSIDIAQNRYLNFAMQTMFYGEPKQTDKIVEGLRNVTKKDVIRCLENTFKCDPSVGIIGNVKPELIQEKWKANLQ